MNTLKLYKYQEEAVQNAVSMLCERGNSLIVAGTGAGKTIMMAAVIGRFYNGFTARHKRKPHVLVLVHRNEIHNQNHFKFTKVCPSISTSEITAARKSLRGHVHFGMVQTVSGLLDEFENSGSYFDLIVIDEAHHTAASTYKNIIEWNYKGKPDSCLLGVTATPNRGDKLPLIHLFDNYNQITTKFLINSHYLVRPTFIDLSPEFNICKSSKSNIKATSEKGYLSRNCKSITTRNEIINKLCDDYLKNKEPGKSIIFAPSHDFCTAIYTILKAKGRNPAYLSLGLNNDARKAEIERFEKGNADELINVDICTEGYDYPELRNLVDFDTNGTHGQWVQKVGRVLRTSKGKSSCTVIDFGGNIDLYPDALETDVNLDGIVKKPKGEKLSEDDLFVSKNEKIIIGYTEGSADEYTPYHAPKGFETVSDNDYGIVFVACGKSCDCIVLNDNGVYRLFLGDKRSISETENGDFNKCVKIGLSKINNQVDMSEREISKLQIRLLAPEYPTSALTWHGANCTICWKTWKNDIKRYIKRK